MIEEFPSESNRNSSDHSLGSQALEAVHQAGFSFFIAPNQR